jgi:hypothetical protein
MPDWRDSNVGHRFVSAVSYLTTVQVVAGYDFPYDVLKDLYE